jgi:gliding motility-associated protein GldL
MFGNPFKTKDSTLNFVYSAGAAVVILGALVKITHLHIPGVSGNFILGLGLGVEALIFLIFAVDVPKEEKDYSWENVYPELLDANAEAKPRKVASVQTSELDVTLSEKLDKMLEDAKLDVSLFERLKSGIDKFSASVDQINSTVDVSAATTKYNDQLTLAASHLESMNALYSLQLDHGRQQSEFSKRYVEDIQKSAEQSEKFNEELAGLTSNLNNLNKVYGGMLSAMKA